MGKANFHKPFKQTTKLHVKVENYVYYLNKQMTFKVNYILFFGIVFLLDRIKLSEIYFGEIFFSMIQKV